MKACKVWGHRYRVISVVGLYTMNGSDGRGPMQVVTELCPCGTTRLRYEWKTDDMPREIQGAVPPIQAARAT